MNRNDIIRMARKAGCIGPGEGGDPHGLWEPNGHENITELMFQFAALVVAAERERCGADAIESMIPHLADLWDENPNAIMFDDMRRYAASIRARK